MGRPASWARGIVGVVAIPRRRAAAWRLRRACRAQAARAAEFASWFELELPKITFYIDWLRIDADWDAVAAACGRRTVADLAGRLGLDAGACGPRALFLAALSTLETYEDAWRLVLGSCAPEDRALFLKIRAIEDRVNAAVASGARLALLLMRGMSREELRDARDGTAKPGPAYSFVSMTPVPRIARWFALTRQRDTGKPHVVVLLDAALARKLGARPALYAIASNALHLESDEEGANRAFRMTNANEMQVHFDVMWPPGSSAALRAVALVGGQDADDPTVPDLPDIPVAVLDDLGLPRYA